MNDNNPNIKSILQQNNDTNKGINRDDIYDKNNTYDMSINNTIIQTTTRNKKQKQYIMPTSFNYNILKTEKYRIVELKNIAKKYKLKVSGKKSELINRIYDFLSTYKSAQVIQSAFKGYLVRKFMELHGPCITLKMRSKCVNDTDFMTLDSIEELKYNQIFTYKDQKGFYYAFDICSIYNLFKIQNNPFNPYTRDKLNSDILDDIKTLVRYSRILKIPINLDLEDSTKDITNPDDLMKIKIEKIFQKMDELGNYTNSDWFSMLNRDQLIRYFRELYDIWVYRAQLNIETKREICPPYGNPFSGINIQTLHLKNDAIIKQSIIDIMEVMVFSGINDSAKSLGVYYVLASLTLVNQQAAQALPWLYESVV